MFGTSPFGVAPFGAKIIVDTGPVPNIGTIEITAPKPAVFCSFAYASATLTAPAPSLSFVAHDSYGENAVLATAPKPTLSSYCGGSAKLSAPSPSLSSTATATGWATATLSAPVPTLSASGAVSAVARVEVTAPVARLIGYGGAVCSITTKAGTLVASGTSGGVARVAVTVPLAQLSASATAQNHASAILVAPAGRMAPTLQAYLVAPAATLTAIGTATITATYEAYALNMSKSQRSGGSEPGSEVTYYTNFPFTHVVRYKNSYYGANSTGLYLLEGTTDDGIPIEWEFKTGMSDFDTPQQKTVTYAYFGGRLGPSATVTIYPSEPTGTSYSYTTPRGQTAQNYRQQFGKGLKARYFAIGASGTDVIELDSIDLTVATLTRRI